MTIDGSENVEGFSQPPIYFSTLTEAPLPFPRSPNLTASRLRFSSADCSLKGEKLWTGSMISNLPEKQPICWCPPPKE